MPGHRLIFKLTLFLPLTSLLHELPGQRGFPLCNFSARGHIGGAARVGDSDHTALGTGRG